MNNNNVIGYSENIFPTPVSGRTKEIQEQNKTWELPFKASFRDSLGVTF